MKIFYLEAEEIADETRRKEDGVDDNFTVEDAAVAFATRAGGAQEIREVRARGARETDERAGVAREAEEIREVRAGGAQEIREARAGEAQEAALEDFPDWSLQQQPVVLKKFEK